MSTRIDWKALEYQLLEFIEADRDQRMEILMRHYHTIHATITRLNRLQTMVTKASIEQLPLIQSERNHDIHLQVQTMHKLTQAELDLYEQLKDLRMSKRIKKNVLASSVELELEQTIFLPLYQVLTEYLSDAGLVEKKETKKVYNQV